MKIKLLIAIILFCLCTGCYSPYPVAEYKVVNARHERHVKDFTKCIECVQHWRDSITATGAMDTDNFIIGLDFLLIDLEVFRKQWMSEGKEWQRIAKK